MALVVWHCSELLFKDVFVVIRLLNGYAAEVTRGPPNAPGWSRQHQRLSRSDFLGGGPEPRRSKKGQQMIFANTDVRGSKAGGMCLAETRDDEKAIQVS